MSVISVKMVSHKCTSSSNVSFRHSTSHGHYYPGGRLGQGRAGRAEVREGHPAPRLLIHTSRNRLFGAAVTNTSHEMQHNTKATNLSQTGNSVLQTENRIQIITHSQYLDSCRRVNQSTLWTEPFPPPCVTQRRKSNHWNNPIAIA